MSTELVIMIISPKELWINDKTYKADDNGIVRLDVNEILAVSERSVGEFDRVVPLTEEQKILFYELFIENNRVGIQDVMGCLQGLSRKSVKDIIQLAINNKVISRHYSQLGTDKEKRDKLRGFLNAKIREKSIREQSIEESPIQELRKQNETIQKVDSLVVPKKKKR
jgi:hypothetical protein